MTSLLPGSPVYRQVARKWAGFPMGHYHDPAGKYDYCADPRCPRNVTEHTHNLSGRKFTHSHAGGGVPHSAVTHAESEVSEV